MADAQTGNMKNKELEKAKAEDEAFSVLPTEEASLAVERVSDTVNTGDGDQEGEGSEDTLEASNLLEKLAQIKISEQKLEDEFNSLIMKGSASSEPGTPFGEREILVPRAETTPRDKKAEIPSKGDEFNILLPKSSGFGPAKRSFPDIKMKEEPVPEKDEEAKLKVKSLLEDKSKEEKLIPIGENKAETEIEAVGEAVKEEKIGFLGKVKSLFKKIEVEIEPYDPQLHGLISEFKGVEGYEEIERYWVNEPYTFIVILYNEETNHHLYYVVEPELTDFEEVLLKEIRDRLRDVLLVEEIDEDTCNKETVLESKIWSIIQDYTLEITSPMLAKISYYIKRDFIRFGKIDALMCDTTIEDVSGNGHDVPIFLYHRTYQNIPTNIVYPENELNSFIIQMAQRSGKHISVAEPIVDATMPDGSRIQMTLGTCVTAHGSTFTIRKFSETPITPVDLIKWGTFSAEAMAYLWLCIENNKSLIYAGGTASGKTSSLNAVSLFIPEKAKVITLEDTRELKLPHPNWIPSMTRDSFTADERGAVDMYDLLKAALRQRPEYLLVGEVRGKEALTLFQAMSTGHTTFSTMHADSVASAIHRLENPPISVPRSMIQALDIMSIQSQTYTKGKRVRRNIKLVEIIDIDPNTRNIRTNDIFVWDSENDVFVRTGESKALFDIKMRRGWGQGRIDEELYYRQKILEYMVNNTIKDFNEISGIINAYQSRPERVLKKLQIT
ncbi:MAG: type II/IV secretion system ATPase subunit [Methanolobus sp.]|uniref:type II/IV secretion system ATPase subunit n=1 Tax=Methanolobus sp. TaxID=1874737 RepID=UPI002730EA6F|nr:type II/IV secretion system ATPase subunit [Methanolobus sp.]MDP2216084.1 type II/IV secretion system ATPase subunit [Methanolobus sp.]